ESLQRGGLKLYAVLRVNPGDYKLQVTVRNAATGGHGVRQQALHAPDFARREAALSPPLFPEAPGKWRVFRQSDSAHELLPFPFVDAQGGGFLPAASPAVPPGGGELVVYAYGPLTDAYKIEGTLANGDGKAAAPAKLTLVEGGKGRFVIQKRLLLRLEGPLPTGAHRLDVTLGDAAGGHTTTSTLAVRETAAATAEVARAAAETAEAEPEQPADEAPALAPGWTKEQLAGRYREVLARAAGGDLDGGARDLAQLELQATPLRRPGQLKALREVERGSLEATSPPQGLLPVIDLATRADLEFLRRGEGWMAAQNRVWAAELTERWVKANADPGARHLAAQLLAGMGSATEALLYEPSNELALLRLAISAEKGGDLVTASEWLRRLLLAHPQSAHGRLRLGVVLRKQGNEAEALRTLTQVMVDEGAERWVAGLACQELAAMAHEKGERDRAEALLRQGTERLNLQSLFLQLAYYLDERQRPDEAVAVLNGMPVVAGPRERSGRHLYNAPPEAELAVARQQVEARVAGDWSQLRAALGVATTAQQGSR
ncbi:MAG TPA: hypothetical protein VGV61_02625, partial [Thermoanaerobaculia bacterium]|nr:hypothetical protein [Thermoanaerobaculia bacterium]